MTTKPSIAHFHITTNFGIITGINYKRWGFWPSVEKIKMPEIAESQVDSIAGFNMSGLVRSTQFVNTDYFTSTAGKALFTSYLEQLKRVIHQHNIAVDRKLLRDLVHWNYIIHIQDPAAPTGTRMIDAFTMLGYEDLEKTALLLKQASKEKVVINDDENEEEYDRHDQYLALCHYAAVEDNHVELHYTDFDNDDFDSDDFETFHKVTLDRHAFANATFVAYTHVKKQVDSVCNALGVNLKRVRGDT